MMTVASFDIGNFVYFNTKCILNKDRHVTNLILPNIFDNHHTIKFTIAKLLQKKVTDFFFIMQQLAIFI